MIAAPCSGSGKTLLSLCLAALARERGEALQPFKVGPDYLDPQLLTALAQRSCRNLDPLLCGEAWVQRSFHWHASRADRVLVEGVMGLFDGRGPGSEGSTAAVACLLDLPVVLVVEASRQAGSLAALVRGFRDHGPPQVRLAGVVLNRVGSERHRSLLAEALASISVPLLGVLPSHPGLNLPSRHLGLLPPGELADLPQRQALWASLALQHLDLDRLWPLLAPPPAPPAGMPDPIQWCLGLAEPESDRAAADRHGASEPQPPAPPAEQPNHGSAYSNCAAATAPANGPGPRLQGDPQPPTSARQQPSHGNTQAGCAAATGTAAAPRPQRNAAESALASRAATAAGAAPAALRAGAGACSMPIAIAADAAFHFRYPEASELLNAVGLEPMLWSPLADEPLPPGCKAVVLPGGYPELHAAQLARSRRSLADLAQAAADGMPIVAECGGLLLLGHQLHDPEDRPHPMAGLLPFSARRGALSLGYRQAVVEVDGLLVRRHERLIGHEFHRWQLLDPDGRPLEPEEHRGAVACEPDGSPTALAKRPALWQLEGWGCARRPEGWTTGRLHATWLHLHWAGCPAIPWRLAAAAAAAASPRPSGASSSPPRPAPAPPRSAGG